MFKVLDRKRKQIDILESPISPVITAELGGIGELTFSVPSTYKHLELEGYIQVENDQEYVIKEIVTHGTNREVVCMLNIEEIVGMAWSTFISKDQDVYKTALQILNGTGWRVVNNATTKETRNLYGKATNSYNLLQLMCTVFDVEFTFDTYEKTVYIVDRVGNDCGTYFINDLNLKQLNIDTHTHKYITRVIPIGKDGLQITSVNDGRNYLENKTYCDKNIYGIWQSDKHDDPAKLKADAQRFLDEMAVPYETYEVLVDDLYALKGYDEFRYNLGDVVTIIDGVTETKIKQRVIQRTYNLQEPDKDTIHIANKDKSFEDYYKRLQTIADMTESVIGSDGTISGGNLADGSVSGDKLESGSINADHIQAGSITADHIQANQIFTEHLVAGSITAELIQANTIDTHHLKANTIQSGHIQSNSIDTNHLKANIINAGHIQSGSITAGSGIIADGAIGNAQISSIDAGKINAGTIDTSRVTVQGANGHLRLKGNRMQVFDGVGNQAKERVSVGDVNGDGTVYGLRVRGADGQTILLDENGVTAEGITDGSITNDKISDNAEIDGAKLNINSVINKINEDGSETISGTKIEVDGTNLTTQLYEINIKQDENAEHISQAQSQITANTNAIGLKVDEQVYTADKADMTSKLEKNTSAIDVLKGQIALKVEQTDIENAKNEMGELIDSKIDSAKAEIKVTTDGISQSVSKVETNITTISGKADTALDTATSAENKASQAQTTANTANNTANQAKSEIQQTNTKLASLETNIDGITSSVSAIEDKTALLDGKVASQETRLATAEQKITPSAITNVVQSAEFVKNMDGKINTNASNISKVEQTANSITNRVEALDGKYTEIKQTVDSIDVTGKVSFSDLSTAGRTTIHGGNIKADTLSINSLSSNNANPIIKLFPTTASDGTRGYCSLDATKQYEQGVGTAIRLKWDSMNYLLQRKSGVEFYMEPREQGASFNFQSDYGHHTSKYESRIITKDGTLCFRRNSNSDENTSSLYFYTGSQNYDRKLLTSYDMSNSVSNTSTSAVATAYAVKQAYDKAVSAYNVGNHSHPYASTSHTHSGYASSSHSHSGSSWESLSLNKGYINYLYYVNGSTTDWSVLSTAHLSPNTTNRYLGQSGSSRRWQSAFLVSSPNVSSDATLKENIEYLDDNSKTRRKGLLTANQLHDFIKNDLRIAEYDYKIDAQSLNECCEDEQKLIRSMNNHQIGFIAQDIVDTEVGAKIVTEDSDGILGYETGNFMAVIAGALQEEIKRREELEAKCADLEDRLAKIEKLIGGM